MSRPSSPTPHDIPTIPVSTAKRQEAAYEDKLASQHLAQAEDHRERAEDHMERARQKRVEADAIDEAEEVREDLYRVRRLNGGGPVTISRETRREGAG